MACMGAFFDTIYIRGADRQAILGTLEHLAAELNCCFLVAPEIRGWTAIYPSQEQDSKVVQAIQALLKCEMLYTVLHDSDAFGYEYYRDGGLLDQFNSTPDYFGKVSARKRRALLGKPGELRGLLRDASDEFELRRLLMSSGDGDVFHAHTMLEGFAKLLGLPNSATSYNYLMANEEEESIERRSEFVHVPDLAPLKPKRPSLRARQ